MHAYLITGNNSEAIDSEIKMLSEKMGAKTMEYPLVKIEDVRNLNNLIRLSFSDRTLIIIKNIDFAGEEALNAFLKNLEEPQENVSFVLTAPSLKKVLPTIVSRCLVLRADALTPNISIDDQQKLEDFLNSDITAQLEKTDRIKTRQEAIKFVEDLIFYTHDKKEFKNSELFIKVLKNLKANGNILLQLTFMVTHLV